tara:strand:- start:619 stop:1590 length:972 start_codon:yes stop_codon:yes gene_type:complete
MNNYSWLEKRLHQLALSSKFMREVMFEFENSSLRNFNDKAKHVFIAGQARSGTTILLNSIYQSNIFASLTYEDMPFILSPNFWSKFKPQKRNEILLERAHGDNLKYSTKSPEAFEEVFWKTFSEDEYESREKFKMYVSNITYKYKKIRYISKNNQNIKRLNLISKIFKNAKILVPFRDPLQQSYSILNQHNKFIKFEQNDKFISTYMNLIGHTEFGPNYIPFFKEVIKFDNFSDINHWIEQWYLIYKNSFEILSQNKNVTFVCYEKLCNNKKYWYEILNKLEISESYEFIFKESIKKVDLKIDKNLLKLCNNLYSKLFDLFKN